MRWFLPIAAAIVASLPPGAARAEPQIIALLATDDAVPLACANGECAAEFTAFCMEPGRKSPYHLTAYRPIAGAADVRAAIVTTAGSVAVPAGDLSFASVRGFAAIRVSLPEAMVASAGGTGIAVTVGRGVALRPLPDPAFHRPHEAEEIARAIGPHRERGERIVDNGGVERAAAGLANRLINALPETARVEAARAAALFDDVVTAEDGRRAGAPALTWARRGFERCLANLDEDRNDTLRGCLARFHDERMWTLTHRYWAGLPGS